MDKDAIIYECWERSLHTLGTSYVFDKKARFYKFWTRIIALLGIIVPLLVGAIVGTYGTKSEITTIAIWITAPLSIIQLVLSGISLVAKWDDMLAYSLESQSENRVITGEYEKLAKFPLDDIAEFRRAFESVRMKDENRTRLDEKISFSEKENRLGMRYALYIRRKECVTCSEVPSSMQPSTCKTCGNF